MRERAGHDRSAALFLALVTTIITASRSRVRGASYQAGAALGACAVAFILCAAAIYVARRSRTPIREVQIALAVQIAIFAELLALLR